MWLGLGFSPGMFGTTKDEYMGNQPLTVQDVGLFLFYKPRELQYVHCIMNCWSFARRVIKNTE